MRQLEDGLPEVCVVGLGYVGLTLATAFAQVGLSVVGVERNPSVVEAANAGRATFHETGLEAALGTAVAAGSMYTFSTMEPMPEARAYVITVGTPVKAGVVWMEDIKTALATVGEAMPDGALVVLRSTVRVGTTSGVARETLSASGKSFRLIMAPERTVEGKALAELTSLPQIVGGIDEESFEAGAALFGALGVEIVKVSTPEAAELSKLASNTYRDVNFAFANELAYMADSFGVDVYEVVHACNHGYSRMNVAKPGPVAGPCLEKDAYILADSAMHFGTEAALSMEGRQTNERMVAHVCRLAQATAGTPTKVAIIGLAFKGQPETSDVRGSQAGPLAAAFANVWDGVAVSGWDPLVSPADASSIGIKFDNLEAAVDEAGVVVLQTNHPYFATEEFAQRLGAAMPVESVIIDLWNQAVPATVGRADVTYVALGRIVMTGKVL